MLLSFSLINTTDVLWKKKKKERTLLYVALALTNRSCMMLWVVNNWNKNQLQAGTLTWSS
jgi:hypothetical protein